MNEKSFTIERYELNTHARRRAADALLDRAFGLGRWTKTSYRFRENETPADGLSFALFASGVEPGDGPPDAIISFWHLKIGPRGHPALLLGPLAVEPCLQGRGYGVALMRHGLDAAHGLGHSLVLLVGDEPYYSQVGFARVPDNRLILPGPVDPDRLLYRELRTGAFDGVEGLVLSPRRFSFKNDETCRTPA